MDTENNFSEFLSDTHIQYMLEYVQRAQEREAAVTDAFLREHQ
jgi:hypothetical protein